MQTPAPVSRVHARRLREIYRSAGWPSLDPIEIDLLAAALIERVEHGDGQFTVRLTDAGIRALSQAQTRNRAAMTTHDRLVEATADAMHREGRIVWTQLAARAAVGHEDGKTNWRMAMPDVFSIRNSTVETMLCPIVHEIKVHRADFLSDLRNEAKREAYLALSSQAFYVLGAKVAAPEEVPEPFGVMVQTEAGLQCARFAPKRPCTLSFGTWMMLAKSTARPRDVDAQAWLNEHDHPSGLAPPEVAP